jgi:peptidoglycan hydrolase CwlO-like protein
MKTEVVVALIVLAGGALTVLGNYLINRRSTSGSVSTSDAASLWAESNALRAEYKERAEKLEARLEDVNKQLQDVFKQLSNLQSKGVKMARKIEELKKLIATLREENERLLAEKKRGVDHELGRS